MSGSRKIGSLTGSISARSTLTGILTIPYGISGDYDYYEGTYKVTPTDEVQVLPTAKKILKEDIVVEASPYVIPEGTEMASGEDVEDVIDDVFGDDEPTYNADDIATDEELNTVLTDVFG